MQQDLAMEELAGHWHHSGMKVEDLYSGRKEDIVKALILWTGARRTQNEATINLLWDFFETNDAILALRKGLESLQDIDLAPVKAKFVEKFQRVEVCWLMTLNCHVCTDIIAD